jgi:hypothetical protein
MRTANYVRSDRFVKRHVVTLAPFCAAAPRGRAGVEPYRERPICSRLGSTGLQHERIALHRSPEHP